MSSINQTVITEWCKETALNTSVTKWQVSWEFIRFIMKPIIGFLVGFFICFYAVLIFGAIAGGGRKRGWLIVFIASIVGTLGGLGGLALVSYNVMNP